MLKSHFRIQQDEEEEEEIEEEATPVVELIEEKEEAGPRSLNKSEVSVRLSWLGKTADGDGFTYLKVQCTYMRLTDITCIKAFKHLQFVNVSHNFLDTEALQVLTELPCLLLVHADKNKLESAGLKRCQYLQVMILNYNFINTLEDFYQPELCTLEAGYNQITEIKLAHRILSMRILDLRYNHIKEIGVLDFPELHSLYLAGNKLTSLVGINTLQNLKILHVRNNPIKVLDGFETELPKLEYLNLRNCKIPTLKQVKKLKGQSALRTLILKGTPYMGGEGKEDPEAAVEEDDQQIRVEILATLPNIIRLNKAEYTPEDRVEAKELLAQWQEEGPREEEEPTGEHNEEEQEED